MENIEEPTQLHIVTDDGNEIETTEAEPLDWWLEALPPAIKANVTQEGWRVSSPDAAQFVEQTYYSIWARKKVNDLQAEETVRLMEEEIVRVKARNEQRNEPFIKALNFWGNHLLDYVLQLRKQDESVKSWKGLYLEVGTRASQAKFEIADKEAFTKWLTDNNKTEWYETEIKPKKTAIKKDVEYQDGNVIDAATGTIIDGLIAEPSQIVAKIDIEEEQTPDGKPILHPVRQLYVFGEEN